MQDIYLELQVSIVSCNEGLSQPPMQTELTVLQIPEKSREFLPLMLNGNMEVIVTFKLIWRRPGFWSGLWTTQ